ncbi:MAG: universal stress protein [Pleurocapsa sp.]
MFNKIIVAIDYSPNNILVFDTALSLAKNTGATLMIMYVLAEEEPGYPMIPSYTYYPILDNYDYNLYKKQLQDYKQRGINFLQEKAKAAKSAGVKTEFSQLTGNPGWSICELANNWAADLIVVGSRGLKGLKEMFLGSVSNYVTHHAPCSILIVRSGIDSQTAGTAEAEKTANQQEFTANQSP